MPSDSASLRPPQIGLSRLPDTSPRHQKHWRSQPVVAFPHAGQRPSGATWRMITAIGPMIAPTNSQTIGFRARRLATTPAHTPNTIAQAMNKPPNHQTSNTRCRHSSEVGRIAMICRVPEDHVRGPASAIHGPPTPTFDPPGGPAQKGRGGDCFGDVRRRPVRATKRRPCLADQVKGDCLDRADGDYVRTGSGPNLVAESRRPSRLTAPDQLAASPLIEG